MIYFRDDDINPNTDPGHMEDCYKIIRAFFPTAEIISGVNIMGKENEEGSVYPGAPFKNNIVKWFYGVNNFLPLDALPKTKIASHGLIHVDHSKIDYDAQEMSILSSCNMLGTKMFIPPFNKFNENTIQICKENDITLIMPSDGWKSLEYNKFDSSHKKWYFHSWRYKPEQLREVLLADLTAINR